MATTTSRAQRQPATPTPDDAAECCAPLAPPQLDATTATRAVVLLRALGDPTRLAIVDLLARQREPTCVCDLVGHFTQSQPTISHHLRILREAGLLECTRRGTWAFYALRPGALDALTAALGQLRRGA
jgi:ArsR family transcriptional regulator